MSPKLAVDNTADSIAARVRHHQQEAKDLAKNHIIEFTTKLAQMQAMALEIAYGGDVYPAGVRDIARRLADDIGVKADTITAIIVRD